MPISSRRDLDPTVPERQGLSLSQQGASVSVRRGTRGERVDVRQTMKPRTNVQWNSLLVLFDLRFCSRSHARSTSNTSDEHRWFAVSYDRGRGISHRISRSCCAPWWRQQESHEELSVFCCCVSVVRFYHVNSCVCTCTSRAGNGRPSSDIHTCFQYSTAPRGLQPAESKQTELTVS